MVAMIKLSMANMAVGLRVRAIAQLGGNYPGSMYSIETGVTGTVIKVDPDPENGLVYGHVAEIKLDQVVDDLFEWGNVLHVAIEHGDANLADFEVIDV